MLRDSEYINLVKTCIKDTISEYYSNGDVDDIINVELSCNDQNFFEILKGEGWRHVYFLSSG
jgi:hypothetical protein